MQILKVNHFGWLESVSIVRSPNYDARPQNAAIKLIVIHGISLPPGQFGGGYIQDFFCNQLSAEEHEYFVTIMPMRVSAHCLIERNGCITQFVSFLDRAWHAGLSEWRGEQGCNDFSIGIELEGTDEQDYSEPQYRQLTFLARCLQDHYPDIHGTSICGHSEISPGRKTDPGPAFDWKKLNALLERSFSE